MSNPRTSSSLTRRDLLEMGGAAALAQLGAAASASLLVGSRASATQLGPITGTERVRTAYRLRVAAAEAQARKPLPVHDDNGDEAKYADLRGCYSKGLPHDPFGEVDPGAYSMLLAAITSGKSADFEAIPLGGTAKLTSPLAAYAFEMNGPDGHHTFVPPAPKFASAERAAEMVEVYWQSLTRDVAYADYATDPIIAEACADLSALSDFTGPKVGGAVTPATIFRHSTGIGMVGPYVSQFLWHAVPVGSLLLEQRNEVPVAGDAYGAKYHAWLGIQNGVPPAPGPVLDPVRRYLRNAHDLGQAVHMDPPYQWGVHAALILLGYGAAALNPTNPYLSKAKQQSFVTWGVPYLLDMIARAADASMKATWFHKWCVNRTLRPEMYAGRVHLHVTGAKSYDLHPDVLNSAVLAKIFSQTGHFLLPLAFPEGSPTHPSYPAGHATFAGATCTMLKAFFDENFVIPNPVVPSADGTSLVPYSGPPLTVGAEVDKLASNVAIGRNAAGVHYRSDAVQSMLLGERVAIGILEDYKDTLSEPFGGFQFTGFDGSMITI